MSNLGESGQRKRILGARYAGKLSHGELKYLANDERLPCASVSSESSQPMEIRSHHFGQLLGQSIGKDAGKTRKMLETSVAFRVAERVADLLALISRSNDHEAHDQSDVYPLTSI